MKRIFLALSVFFCVSGFSQAPYIPLALDSTCYWIHEYDVNIAGQHCTGLTTTVVEKDTLINSLIYHKLQSYISSKYYPPGTCLGLNDLKFPMYLREDTASRTILMHDLPSSMDFLLMDYALQMGDTLWIANMPHTIDSITTAMLNGVSRRLQWYHITGGSFPAYTIEGIGNLYNFPRSGFGSLNIPFFKLKCFKKSGVTLFPDSPVDSCLKGSPLSVVQEINSDFHIAYASNRIVITNPSLHPYVIKLIDMSGRLIYWENMQTGSYQKDLSEICSHGLYVLFLQDGNKRITKKLQIGQ